PLESTHIGESRRNSRGIGLRPYQSKEAKCALLGTLGLRRHQPGSRSRDARRRVGRVGRWRERVQREDHERRRRELIERQWWTAIAPAAPAALRCLHALDAVELRQRADR